MAREFESFVDGFVEFTENLPSSALWRKWAAIGTISGILERKVYTFTLNSNLYPNQFIWLIGPPGVGKTVLTSIVTLLWRAVGDINVAPSNASSASFLDALRAKEKRIIQMNNPAMPFPESYHAIAASINELGVLINQYDNELIATLTDLYDGKEYSERKRGLKLEYTLTAPCVNMIACGTPSFLGDLLPDGAWTQGMMSRVSIIYSGIARRPPLFGGAETNKKMFERLKRDAKEINKMMGEMKFEPAAMAALSAWYDAGGPPIPDHPKLESYNIRRTAKLLKLCMVACAASSDKPYITTEHYQTALGWLIESEKFMPEVFKAMTSGSQTEVVKELWFATYNYFVKHKEGMPENLVYEHLSRRIPLQQIKPLMEGLLQAKVFEAKLDPLKDIKLWKPKAKGAPTADKRE